MTDEELEAIATTNVERHIGDVCADDDDQASIYESVRVLAMDALHDHGCRFEDVKHIIDLVSEPYKPEE